MDSQLLLQWLAIISKSESQGHKKGLAKSEKQCAGLRDVLANVLAVLGTPILSRAGRRDISSLANLSPPNPLIMNANGQLPNRNLLKNQCTHIVRV